jgi:uncharacterized membrane protein YdjX (TVP38/TMEM64 family)
MTKEPDQKNFHPHPHQKLFSVLAVLTFLAFCVAIGYFVGRPMLKFVSEPEQFRLWVDGHGFLGRLAFIGMMALQVIFALIPGEPLEIGAGYAFGFWEGTLLCMIGIILGSSLVFGMTRKWGTRVVALFFSMEKIQSLKFLQDSKRLHILTFFLFFIPGTPKDLLTYVAGLTPITLKTYLLISNVARIPSVVTSTIGGNALGEQRYAFAVVTFAIVATVSVVGLFIYRHITARKAKKESEQNPTSLPPDSQENPDQGEDQ